MEKITYFTDTPVVTADGIAVIPVVERLSYTEESGNRVVCAGVSEVKAVVIVTEGETFCLDIQGSPVELERYGIDSASLTEAIDKRFSG